MTAFFNNQRNGLYKLQCVENQRFNVGFFGFFRLFQMRIFKLRKGLKRRPKCLENGLKTGYLNRLCILKAAKVRRYPTNCLKMNVGGVLKKPFFSISKIRKTPPFVTFSPIRKTFLKKVKFYSIQF